jgi:hypothetical protein
MNARTGSPRHPQDVAYRLDDSCFRIGGLDRHEPHVTFGEGPRQVL